jgi:hypothetical protein
MEKATGSKTFKWKREIELEGTIDQIKGFDTYLADKFKPPLLKWKAGYMKFDYIARFGAEKLKVWTEGATRMKGINGGMKTPHLHVGDEVVLVDKQRFKTILGEVARDIFEQRVDKEQDYFSMIEPLVGK